MFLMLKVRPKLDINPEYLSSSSAMDSGSLPPSAIEPIIEAYAQGIRPAFAFILIPAIFSAMLVPLLIMLFTLSTPQVRRGPIFILNTAAICFGLTLGALITHLAVGNPMSSGCRSRYRSDGKRSFTIPHKHQRRRYLVYVILDAWLPWIAESVLLVRIWAVFPRAKLPFVLAFPVLIKIARSVVNILFIVGWAKGLFHPTTVNELEVIKQLNPLYFKLGAILELFDNAYISGLFLWRLARTGHVFNGQAIGRLAHKQTYSGHLENLFWIASTNFVFPIIISVIEIAAIYSGNVVLGSCLNLVNCYVEIISTVFATVWSSTASFAEATRSTAFSTTSYVQPRPLPDQPIELFMDRVVTVTMDPLPDEGQEGKPGPV
ncbi:unnamed protein product [Mycena citricolor]|uniref:Uncharacterized protein n=1 Tax=Mycena citricolor TaxID=2018698 RepID=A0AAD2GT18_9AGAR|nr:unnamed protein product [Mycena citricolor]